MNTKSFDRRSFIKNAGISAAAFPFLGNLDALALPGKGAPKQRMVIFFSPNGVVPESFWPNEDGENFLLKEIFEFDDARIQYAHHLGRDAHNT